jgi:uncharacterized phage protein (TIGR02218 family)
VTTFDQDEASRRHNRPIEFIDIALPTKTYRIACGNRDLMVGSIVYKAQPAARTEIVLAQVRDGDDDGLIISLPPDHAVVRRWFQAGVPPRQTLATVWRKQERSQIIEKIWAGIVTSIAIDSTQDSPVAKLLVPASSIDTMQRYLPTISAGPSCPHILYSPECTVDPAAFTVTTTALFVDGRDVRIDMGAGHGGDWAEGGMLVDVASGEPMTITKQTDISPSTSSVATLTLQLPLPDLRAGNAIQVLAGCDKSMAICDGRYGNRQNHGGFPQMPSKNLFTPGSIGLGEL